MPTEQEKKVLERYQKHSPILSVEDLRILRKFASLGLVAFGWKCQSRNKAVLTKQGRALLGNSQTAQ